ncbi:hypothetical protein SAMN02910357_02310 [Succinivibrio dextrinosolvens]|uniref:AAA family ATPase n=1 Tax=Succinivibrio dextrinosolvens TaxID=83771 RepID=UPI0008E33B7C|nr:ATP-binding protein [Succinivibrio dextrinosolvens]SFS87000.1 hypothetical protein SAMN02910357_02310 [Succinivibrio dextrinosolvens]
MFLKFAVENFRSFKEEYSISFIATAIKGQENSLIKRDNISILPVLGIFGPNSSGKSNIIFAYKKMRKLVLNSVKLNPDEKLDFDPFLLNKASSNAPTKFEIEFFDSDIRYTYGFSYDSNEIKKEWLKHQKVGQKTYSLFFRDANKLDYSQKLFPEGKDKIQATATNRLFLSLCAQLNGAISQKIINFFKNSGVVSGSKPEYYAGFSLTQLIDKSEQSQKAIDFFKRNQLGFSDLIVTQQKVSDLLREGTPGITEDQRKALLQFKDKVLLQGDTIHNYYDDQGNKLGEVNFDHEERESEGTKKIIAFSGPLFDALSNGLTIFADELDSQIHTSITRRIIELFKDPRTNPHGAQLIFSANDIALLDFDVLRRDQILFTRKNRYEMSKITPVTELFGDKERKQKIRSDKLLREKICNGDFDYPSEI